MKNKKIVVYAINKDGDGHVQVVGKYDYIEEVKIRVGMFASDVILEFSEQEEENIEE